MRLNLSDGLFSTRLCWLIGDRAQKANVQWDYEDRGLKQDDNAVRNLTFESRVANCIKFGFRTVVANDTYYLANLLRARETAYSTVIVSIHFTSLVGKCTLPCEAWRDA